MTPQKPDETYCTQATHRIYVNRQHMLRVVWMRQRSFGKQSATARKGPKGPAKGPPAPVAAAAEPEQQTQSWFEILLR